MSAQAPKCPECGSKRGEPIGISYIDHSKPVTHAYHSDHMNAHICTNKWHSAAKKGHGK